MHHDLLNDLINSLTILPGVGKKSAQRMALYLFDKNKDGASILAKTLEKAIDNIARFSRAECLLRMIYARYAQIVVEIWRVFVLLKAPLMS